MRTCWYRKHILLIYAHARVCEGRPTVRLNGLLITIHLAFTYDFCGWDFVKLLCKLGNVSTKPFVKEIRRWKGCFWAESILKSRLSAFLLLSKQIPLAETGDKGSLTCTRIWAFLHKKWESQMQMMDKIRFQVILFTCVCDILEPSAALSTLPLSPRRICLFK